MASYLDAGAIVYKVWSQELVPTLLRSTAQGLNIAFTRLMTALFAFVTPTLLTANSSLSFGLLFAFAVISAAIGLFWVPRLPKATELEPAEAVFSKWPPGYAVYLITQKGETTE